VITPRQRLRPLNLIDTHLRDWYCQRCCHSRKTPLKPIP
jgi:hypothetical protein